MVDRRTVTIVTSTLMAAFSIAAVVLRTWARRRCKAGLGADDWTIFAALVCMPRKRLAARGPLLRSVGLCPRLVCDLPYWLVMRLLTAYDY